MFQHVPTVFCLCSLERLEEIEGYESGQMRPAFRSKVPDYALIGEIVLYSNGDLSTISLGYMDTLAASHDLGLNRVVCNLHAERF